MKSPVETGPSLDQPAEPSAEPKQGKLPEQLIQIGGLAVAVVAAVVTGVLELFLTTLRAGDVLTLWRGDTIGSGHGPLLGLSVVLAVVGNTAIAWFAYSTTGRRWSVGPPWALWTIVTFFAASARTAEGDYLLGGTNYIAVATILLGSLTFAVYMYRLILRRAPR